MFDIFARTLFLAAGAFSIAVIYTSVRDQWDRIIEVLSYDLN